MSARYLVGIDLGTTNSALAYIDSSERPRVLHDFPLPQLVGPGDVAARPTLPSLHHHVGEHELPAGATRLPWTLSSAPAPDFVVGELARTQSQAVPGRVIASAKSWLCHPRVDRLQDILPWGAAPDVPRLSPVEASARYLRHMLSAFCHERGCMQSQLEVVLTVPASFDEVARELTVEAARRAGLDLGQLTLLEEPQAAFYHWLAEHARLGEEVEAGDQIFVCDIGGGTTDFTLIQVHKNHEGKRGERRVGFTRTAVGDHILLGGDNMDLALARRVESQLQGVGASPGKLGAHVFSGLVQACRTAKEKLLSDAPPASYRVHVAGRGSRLIGGGVQADLQRQEVEQVLLDGFFPRVGKDAEPARSRGGLTEFGLPYAADPGVTRYIAAFLRQHRAAPSRVLFNGGVLCSPSIRERILDVLYEITGRRPQLLSNPAPDLAVARGAAYYALARTGEGLRISGGAARAYYIEVENSNESGNDRRRTRYVCLTPRGLEEGAEVDLSSRPFELLTNRPVRFRLFASAQREGDRPGDVLDIESSDELSELPPLYTVLRHPKTSQERPLRVTLAARLTEIGTLDLWAVSGGSSDASATAATPPATTAKATASGKGSTRDAGSLDGTAPMRWRLQFDLRGSEGGPARATSSSEGVPAVASAGRSSDGGSALQADALSPDQAGLIAAATEQIRAVFVGEAPAASLPRQLSTVLGPRDGWSTAILRGLWEELKKHREARSRSPAHEARWLNLGGFCLRPGFGYPLDDWRVKEAWRVFNAGLVHERDETCKLEWWILWRRIAGGLSRTQQDELWKRVAPLLLPQARKPDKKPPSPQEAAEIWRAVSACERIESKKKAELGDVLLGLIEKRRSEAALWSLGRIGTRMPLYGPIDNVVAPVVVSKWLGRLLALPIDKAGAGGTSASEEAYAVAHAVAELGRMTGDRVRDVADGTLRQRVAEWLQRVVPGDEGAHLAHVVRDVVPREEREERFAFGDTLPAGLRLLSDGER
ncbi:MAG: hsp70 family protein [Myxococcales bacterium]|nr:hsp70 family protein [Myxococcales bacterium]